VSAPVAWEDERAELFPCCPHCVDDLPHIEKDTHTLSCDVCDRASEIGRLTAERDAYRARLDKVREDAEQWRHQWNADHMKPETFDQGVGAHAQDVLAILDETALDGEAQG
jgi:hypothetical protein